MSKSSNGPVNEAQATKLGISFAELQELAKGKSCPTYGTSEQLHARKVRGGKVAVFNISEKARGAKISATKAEKKAEKEATAASAGTTTEAVAN